MGTAMAQQLITLLRNSDTITFSRGMKDFFKYGLNITKRRNLQAFSEIAFHDILRLFATTPYDAWCEHGEDLGFYIKIMSLTTTAAVKRILKEKFILRKVVNILENIIEYQVPLEDDTERLFYKIHCGAYSTLYFLSVCVHGSTPNNALWKEVFGKFDFRRILKVLKGDYTWLVMTAGIIQSLAYVHGFRFPRCLLNHMKKYGECHRVKTPCTPAGRLLEFIDVLDEQYIVYCSNPDCAKTADRDFVFPLCSRCKLARYCCVDCQKKHWKEGHKEQCLDKNTPLELPDDLPQNKPCNNAPSNTFMKQSLVDLSEMNFDI